MVPPLGTKFMALCGTGMKEAEGEEHGVELLLSGTHIHRVLKKKRERVCDTLEVNAN